MHPGATQALDRPGSHCCRVLTESGAVRLLAVRELFKCGNTGLQNEGKRVGVFWSGWLCSCAPRMRGSVKHVAFMACGMHMLQVLWDIQGMQSATGCRRLSTLPHLGAWQVCSSCGAFCLPLHADMYAAPAWCHPVQAGRHGERPSPHKALGLRRPLPADGTRSRRV